MKPPPPPPRRASPQPSTHLWLWLAEADAGGGHWAYGPGQVARLRSSATPTTAFRPSTLRGRASGRHHFRPHRRGQHVPPPQPPQPRPRPPPLLASPRQALSPAHPPISPPPGTAGRPAPPPATRSANSSCPASTAGAPPPPTASPSTRGTGRCDAPYSPTSTRCTRRPRRTHRVTRRTWPRGGRRRGRAPAPHRRRQTCRGSASATAERPKPTGRRLSRPLVAAWKTAA